MQYYVKVKATHGEISISACVCVCIYKRNGVDKREWNSTRSRGFQWDRHWRQ